MNKEHIKSMAENSNSNWLEYRIYILETLSDIKTNIDSIHNKINDNDNKINDLVTENKVSNLKIAGLGIAGGCLYQLCLMFYNYFLTIK